MSGNSSAEEMRKLQLTGGSTFIVSLPKDWVKQMGLEKGSLVSIVKDDDLSLRIRPKVVEKGDRQRRAVISVSHGDDPNSVAMSKTIRACGVCIFRLSQSTRKTGLHQRSSASWIDNRHLIS